MLICRYEPAIGLLRFDVWLLVRAMVQIRPGSGAEPRYLGSSPTSNVFCLQMQKPDSSGYAGYTKQLRQQELGSRDHNQAQRHQHKHMTRRTTT